MLGLQHPHQDWHKNGSSYWFPTRIHAEVSAQPTKLPDGTIQVKLANVLHKEELILTGSISAAVPSPEGIIRVFVRWGDNHVDLLIDGKQVATLTVTDDESVNLPLIERPRNAE